MALSVKSLLPLFGLWAFSSLLKAAEKGTANFYQSAPHEYLGKEIRLRVASLTPVPELTAADNGFVWMEATTGRPQKEEGRILLRIPEADSAKLAKLMNLPSSSGRWLEGVFAGHDHGIVLPTQIKARAPYYIQISSAKAQKESSEDLEPTSGSLVLAPIPKNPKNSQVPPASRNSIEAVEASPPVPPTSEGPKVVLLRNKAGEPLHLRIAKSVKPEADFCEIIDQEGKLSLVGKALIVAILPLPKEGVNPTPEEADGALRMYAEQAQASPEVAALLAGAKATWEKHSSPPGITTANAPLPQLEDVETAAGLEEPGFASSYPAWFVWGTGLGVLLLIILSWAWSRPRSTPA